MRIVLVILNIYLDGFFDRPVLSKYPKLFYDVLFLLHGVIFLPVLQAAFYGLVITHVIGVIRLILEIVYPVPRCGEVDNRPAILSKVHGFYFAQMMMVIELIVIIVISMFTKRNTEEEVKY